MKVSIHVYAFLRGKLGWNSKTLEVEDNVNLRRILEFVPELRDILVSDGGLNPRFMVLLNGRNVRLLGGLDTPVEDGTRIDVFPPAGGG